MQTAQHVKDIIRGQIRNFYFSIIFFTEFLYINAIELMFYKLQNKTYLSLQGYVYSFIIGVKLTKYINYFVCKEILSSRLLNTFLFNPKKAKANHGTGYSPPFNTRGDLALVHHADQL